MIRTATYEDLDDLLEIENRCFVLDRFSRRTFRYLLTKANAETIIDEVKEAVRGYATVLFHAGISLARLYSIAVDPVFQGQSIGKALIKKAEEKALAQDCVAMRIEVRRDNTQALSLYEALGYRRFDIVDDYYEDHMEAIRLEKSLAPHLKPDMVRIPFYEQTLEFTCGPSALIMAMKTLDPSIAPNRTLELRLWRESTSIFMTSGHGGCGPYGMTLSAYHRGFDVEVYVSGDNPLFIDSVRSPEKKEVIRIVQKDFMDEINELPITLTQQSLTIAEIQQKFEEGGIPLVLISSYRIYHEKSPHWVVVTGFDEKYIYVHDPYVDKDMGKTATDCINMPILRRDFERMARYGKAGLKAILIIKKRTKNREVSL